MQNWVLSFEYLKRWLPTRQTLPLRCGLPGGSLRLTGESRSIQAAARALNINPELLDKVAKTGPHGGCCNSWGGARPATATELRHLRALARRPKQELDILKKAIASAYFKRGR